MDISLPDATSALVLDGRSLTIEDVVSVARYRRRVGIADNARVNVARCRALVDVLLDQDEKVYGLTTGFGKLRDVTIPPEDTKKLQENLIRSHSAGVGEPLPEDVVRAAILLRANTLCRGNSGVRVVLLEQLVALLNDDVFPYVPAKGSVGASGDLAPLSHLTLVLIGDEHGRYYPREKRDPETDFIVQCKASDFEQMPDADTLERIATEQAWAAFRPITLEAKEGLALNNGTQFMTAIACLALWDGLLTLRYAELAAAMSLEANRGVRHAFRSEIHDVRPQGFQSAVAQRIIGYCVGSQILDLLLNTGYLHQARRSLADAADHLKHLRLELDRQGSESPASVADALAGINVLRDAVAKLIPRNAEGNADPSWVDRFAGYPARGQIAALDEYLASVRSMALSLLRIVQDPTFPKFLARARAESSLVAALDALRKAVPDSPPVQDDYSFRCSPQVLSGAYRAHSHVAEIVKVEINSATDNPLLFPFAPESGFEDLGVPDEADSSEHYEAYRLWLSGEAARIRRCTESVVGGGNFHGQPIATVMDYLAIALAEVGSIAERRIAHLVDDNLSEGLPGFLINGTGLNSGFMIPQYTAAALVSENKVLCHPASVDSIPTCANTEDHVSMGTIAARKCAEVVANVRWVVAIEVLAAYQGLGFREPLEPGRGVREAIEIIQGAKVRRYEDDRVMFPDIVAVEALLRDCEMLDRCSQEFRSEL